jgi:small subunit ribosomal protein S2
MSVKVDYKVLLDAGVHFGHLTRKWNPKMASYIFMERNGIHIIDLNKTVGALENAANAMKSIAKSGKKIMFVATKKQAKEMVADEARRLKMPYVTERWLGGMLTNFTTVRKSLKKMQGIERQIKDETLSLNKKEKLMLSRDKEKMERVLGGIADLTRLPSALFIVDVGKEHIAVKEAKRLGIPVFAMVDTNSDPDSADFPIPANDDAFKSIAVVTQIIGQAIEEGLMERKRERDEEKEKEGADAKANEDMNSDGGAAAPATIAEALAPAPTPAAKTGRTRMNASEAPAKVLVPEVEAKGEVKTPESENEENTKS